jgi:hypothetical protein
VSETDLFSGLQIPPRRSCHRGEWAPIYLEPLPSSGERICIGIVAWDGDSLRTVPVTYLERLECAYGTAARSIAWSAHLVMLEVKSVAEKHGIAKLIDSVAGIEGASVGASRIGAGRDLDDLAMLALHQSSTLTAAAMGEMAPVTEHLPERASPIAKAVQRAVVGIRPELRDAFGRHFSLSKFARPTVYGFVGRRIVANFASLGGVSADTLGSQVDRAKARLWDLEQLQKGVLRDVFGAPMSGCEFELLACPPQYDSKVAAPKRPLSPGLLREAVETLEREADKFEIRWKYLRSPLDIANFVLEREAA